jgi:hypothetical protein
VAGENQIRNAFSSARCRFLMNGIEVGWGTRVSGSEAITNMKVKVLGEIDVQDIVPTDRDVNMNVGFVRIVKESLQLQGLWPRGETIDILTWPYMSAELFDRIEDGPIYKIEGVKAATRNFSVDQGGILMVDANFDAIRMKDELEA